MIAAAVVAMFGLGAAACTSENAANQTAGAISTVTASTGALAAGQVMSGDAAAPDATSSEAVASPADDNGDGSPATVAPPLPNTVSGAPAKVSREGQPTEPSVVAGSVAFSDPTQYSDNAVLSIAHASKEIESGNGPGVFDGREFVKFDLELKNGSGQAIDLNSVVVTTYYGSTNQLAAPVYTPSAGTQDFTGIVEPGATATASYGFAVPVSELGNVTMVVDFDAVHSSATFSGAVNI